MVHLFESQHRRLNNHTPGMVRVQLSAKMYVYDSDSDTDSVATTRP